MFSRHFFLAFVLATLFCSIANAELVSQWQFSGNANDTMGLNNGTLMNGASVGTDPIHGQVLSLDGSNDYVNCGNNSSLDVGRGSFTVAAWVKRPPVNSVYDIVAKRMPFAPYTGWAFEMFWWYDNSWHIKVWTPQENGTELSYAFAANTWYHVAAVRDALNSQITYYVNGQAMAALPFSNADLSNTANLSIGRLSQESLQYFNGSIDDVRIYNTALTAEEIAAIIPERAQIPGLFNTGVDDNGTRLPADSLEEHYTLTGMSSPAYVFFDGAPSPQGIQGNWLRPAADAMWIGPLNGAFNAPNGDYAYTLTFDMGGLDPATAVISGQWASDNLSTIYFNGSRTAFTRPNVGFSSLANLTISAGFRPGINTLEFRVTNTPFPPYNPTGLLVQNLRGEANRINLPPVANAGNDQLVYAGLDGMANVTLEGSDSNDIDGDELICKWTWTIDGQINEANGVSPTIKLPVGTHTIQLIVNDGLTDSAPDDVNIMVIAAIEGGLKITPQTINRRSNQPSIQALITLPNDITKDDVDSDEPLILHPGGIEAASQAISKLGKGISADFDKAALMDAVPASGDTELAVSGKLKSGQCFYGKTTVKIIH